MASYEYRAKTIRVSIRDKAIPSGRHRETFPKTPEGEAEADRWVKKIEAEIQLRSIGATSGDVYIDEQNRKKISLDYLLLKYRDGVVTQRADTSIVKDGSKVNVLRAYVTGLTPEEVLSIPDQAVLEGVDTLADLTPSYICKFIEHRMFQDGRAWSTVTKDLATFRGVLNALETWSLPSGDPSIISRGVKMFRNSNGGKAKEIDVSLQKGKRERRVKPEEYKEIVKSRTVYSLLAEFAIETAMRCGEIAELRVSDINFDTGVIRIRKSKTDHKTLRAGRTIPMSKRAEAITRIFIEGRIGRGGAIPPGSKRRLFNNASETISANWAKFADKRGFDNLTFHDMRHEATTRLIERGWTISQVAAVTGHSSSTMVDLYTNLSAEDLARKLRRDVDEASVNEADLQARAMKFVLDEVALVSQVQAEGGDDMFDIMARMAFSPDAAKPLAA